MFIDHHNTSVTNVHARKTVWEGHRGGFIQPATGSVGNSSDKKDDLKIKIKKEFNDVVDKVPGSCKETLCL